MVTGVVRRGEEGPQQVVIPSDTQFCAQLGPPGGGGYPGGGNNMSPYTPEICDIRIVELPARANVRLWRAKPRSTKAPPDMLFLLHFE